MTRATFRAGSGGHAMCRNRDRLILKYGQASTRGRMRAAGRSRFAKALNTCSGVLRAGCAATLLILAQGCATTPKPVSPPSADLRASLGTVGVVSVGPPLRATVLGPVSIGSQAGKGALKGAEIGGLSGGGAGGMAGFGCGP